MQVKHLLLLISLSTLTVCHMHSVKDWNLAWHRKSQLGNAWGLAQSSQTGMPNCFKDFKVELGMPVRRGRLRRPILAGR